MRLPWALSIINDAEATGRLRAGGTIIEGTAGNTGVGLATIGHARGYRTVAVIEETQSPDKIALLRALGSEVITVPEKPYSDPGHFSRTAQRLAEERGWFWANQFDNTANRDAHFRTTGPEIWEQTQGGVTGFVSAVGTGGTLAGTSSFLKSRNPNLRAICADPCGAAMWAWFARGVLDVSEGDSCAEGIGQTRITKNLEGIKVDGAYCVTDQAAVSVVYQLMREEGLFLGWSSGINLAGACRFARDHGPGQIIVTILCDSGYRYLSTLYHPAWLSARQLDPNQPVAL
jgi:cysteine synthase A